MADEAETGARLARWAGWLSGIGSDLLNRLHESNRLRAVRSSTSNELQRCVGVGKSGGGLPQSKTLARWPKAVDGGKHIGVLDLPSLNSKGHVVGEEHLSVANSIAACRP